MGRAISTLVVQERHLWLCLADMKEQEKVQFLNAPVSQTGLFGDAVESFSQQFSAAQKQTEAIKYIMCRRKPAASTPAAAPQPARCSGRLPAAAPCSCAAAAAFHQASTRQRRGAGHRQDAQPHPGPRQTWRQAQVQEALRRATQRWRRLHREMVTAPLPPLEECRVENLLFLFRKTKPRSQRYPTLQ